MQLEGLVYAVTLLFFIFDPFASLPIFICMTKDLDDNQKTSSANRAVLVAALLFVIFAVLGTNLLGVFSVTLDGFRIAGGIVLLLMAIGDHLQPKPYQESGRGRRLGHHSHSDPDRTGRHRHGDPAGGQI